MADINWSSDFYSDMFSLQFDNLFETIDLESLQTLNSTLSTESTVLESTSTVIEQANERVPFSEKSTNLPDESRFPHTSYQQIKETLQDAENKNTKRSTKTWMNVWFSWAKSRQINEELETMAPATLDEVLQQFYLEVRKQDGSEYEPDSLKVMQAALERYLLNQKYPYSLINGREFTSSRAVLDAKAKQLRMNGYGKRKNRAQPYNSAEEEKFWSSGLLGDHSGAALTNANFKNLSEHFGFRGRQDHYDAYVEDFEVAFVQVDGGKNAQVVRFKENPTKTRTCGLTAKHRKTPQEMWATDGGQRDPVRLFEEFIRRRPLEMRTSGPLYLAIIQRPKTDVWYSKSRMGVHKLGSIMKTLATSLNMDGKKISNHSTRKAVVAKLKKAGQPRHKIIQITGHASENSLDDYDEIGEDERMELSHIISGFSSTTSTTTATTTSKIPPSSSSLAVPATSAVLTSPAVAQSPTCVPSFIQTSPVPPQMLFTRTSSSASHNYDPSVQHFSHCTLNIQNYFGSQSSNQLASSRMESSMECQIASTQANTVRSPPVRKRRKAYIIESDED